jgi:hypothetical protein
VHVIGAEDAGATELAADAMAAGGVQDHLLAGGEHATGEVAGQEILRESRNPGCGLGPLSLACLLPRLVLGSQVLLNRPAGLRGQPLEGLELGAGRLPRFPRKPQLALDLETRTVGMNHTRTRRAKGGSRPSLVEKGQEPRSRARDYQ